MEAVILCGGLGTRLRAALPDRQKTVAPIGGTTFLEFLLDRLRRRGFTRFVLCAGHKAEQIEELGIPDAVISREDAPLGTAGAVRNARELITSEAFHLFNGDSFCDFDYAAMPRAPVVTMALVHAEPNADGGFVRIDAASRVIGFREKDFSSGFSYLNAGVYLCSNKIFARLPEKGSLETDVFPKLKPDEFLGYPVEAKLRDIGTPEKLRSFATHYGSRSS